MMPELTAEQIEVRAAEIIEAESHLRAHGSHSETFAALALGRGGCEHRGFERRRRRLGVHQPFAAGQPVRVGPHHLCG
jgi:hypothetical protein